MSDSGSNIPNTFVISHSGAKQPRKRATQRMAPQTTQSRSTRKGSSGFRGWNSR